MTSDMTTQQPPLSQELSELHTLNAQPEWGQVWKVTRALLVVWAVAVWVLLILFPGVGQISDMASDVALTVHADWFGIGGRSSGSAQLKG